MVHIFLPYKALQISYEIRMRQFDPRPAGARVGVIRICNQPAAQIRMNAAGVWQTTKGRGLPIGKTEEILRWSTGRYLSNGRENLKQSALYGRADT